eukprot:SAG11_NODE_1665_length_4495_cov_40.440400_2_plen_277_part_00
MVKKMGKASSMLEELQLLVEEAREVADLWRRRVEASYDLCGEDEDMLVDAEEWLRASSWVLSQAEAEVDGGRPGQFVELGATITEEAAAGATMDDLMIYIWATAGVPPEAEVMAVDAGEVAELKAVAEAEAVVAEGPTVAVEREAKATAEVGSEVVAEVVDTTEVEAVAAAAAAEAAAAVAEAAARATATAVAEAVVAADADDEEEAEAAAGYERDPEQAGVAALDAGEVTGGAGAEALTWVRKGGGLRPATVAEAAVAWRPRRWKERQRIFDPGG